MPLPVKPPPTRQGMFGFQWGKADVVRLYSHGGNVVIGIQTDSQSVTVCVSSAGKIEVDPLVPHEAGARRRWSTGEAE